VPEYKKSAIVKTKVYRRNHCSPFRCYEEGLVYIIDEKVKASDFGIKESARLTIVKRLLD
jgi:hypothetical protein